MLERKLLSRVSLIAPCDLVFYFFTTLLYAKCNVLRRHYTPRRSISFRRCEKRCSAFHPESDCVLNIQRANVYLLWVKSGMPWKIWLFESLIYVRRYLRGVPLSGIELNARGSQRSHSTETVLETDDRTRLGGREYEAWHGDKEGERKEGREQDGERERKRERVWGERKREK